jgi:hypothetical protein
MKVSRSTIEIYSMKGVNSCIASALLIAPFNHGMARSSIARPSKPGTGRKKNSTVQVGVRLKNEARMGPMKSLVVGIITSKNLIRTTNQPLVVRYKTARPHRYSKPVRSWRYIFIIGSPGNYRQKGYTG